MNIEVSIGTKFGSSSALTDKVFLQVIEHAGELSEFVHAHQYAISESSLKIWERNYIFSCCATLIVDLAQIMRSASGETPPSNFFVDHERFDSVTDVTNYVLKLAADLLAFYKEYQSKLDDKFYSAALSADARYLIKNLCIVPVKLWETDLVPYIESAVAERKFKSS